MEEILPFPNMTEIDLIYNLEKISSNITNRILRLEGYIYKDQKKEKLEIIIFKGISSSTTHPIEYDLEKKVIRHDHSFINFKLFEAPLKPNLDNFIKENKSYFFFLNQKNWI